MIIHTYMKITAGLWFRFREVYYWDSYWTIKGLLLSELYDTTEGMLRNFKVLHYSKIRIE
jgi:neutral trehalase